jgi:hypothetical protein
MSSGPRRGKSGADETGSAALTGGGPSQLGVNGSMRARDVSRPRPGDLDEAEQLVQVSFRPRRTTGGEAPPAGR